jgi:hypothetical protein
MALASVKGGEWWPSPPFLNAALAASIGSVQLNVASEKMAIVFQAAFTGTLSEVDFYISAVGSSGDVDVRVETIDAATGNPSGSLAGTNSNLSMTISTTGAKTAALTAAVSLTQGTYYAIVFSGTSGDISLACFNRVGSGGGWDTTGVYPRYHNGTSWSSRGLAVSYQYVPCIALKLNDGSYPWLGGTITPFQSLTNVDFNNTSSDRERGIRFIPRGKKRAIGFFAATNIHSGNANVILANTSGTALATYTGDKDYGSSYSAGSGVIPSMGFFASAVTLDAGTTYYLTIVPQSATNVRIVDGLLMDTGEANQMNVLSGGTDVVLVTRDSGGTYTVDTTKRPLSMGLIFDQSDDGAGGGGGGLAANPIRGFVA